MVGLGDESATDPADGSRWRVKWSQDDTGKLVVLGAERASGGARARSRSPSPAGRSKQTLNPAKITVVGSGAGSSSGGSGGGGGGGVGAAEDLDGVAHCPSEASPGRWDIATQTAERYSSSGGFYPAAN
ncbi:hypothetical protein MNEG_12464 [Monoraphidium neglectum]|uniref:Uncharacterized protein n=1 Tax=Monoraphidium neglectum TaxID=145388 RepID=A0A0D2KI76_9CHLO|nr:hypothetical protein MNEG_12464 [Monoraphidium neglectum]KIY95498.1 hypothetical protein MNEG_12464 [Monoraphidium neglectum]|eukprot:XP_013894518.1 hypothetical protein MNEG_12464 [Monoraphidium neglectum]